MVGLTGNLLVCRVAFGTRQMRTTTNLLIASLACSDIVMIGIIIIKMKEFVYYETVKKQD
ncbi:hypothetical protein BLA29_001683 [Euroglyphus maynei]|uniref:G-protein coupled receptors family 1 profile domain-containing protein n=1 Tax=Euroglyphus maynei TaxID=6958 RepID=A0A1Y3BHX8_EURMA|nr:hypothetical protein BLA29_001683 [Euroglyphus maynei]